jgi:hypothetical protein
MVTFNQLMRPFMMLGGAALLLGVGTALAQHGPNGDLPGPLANDSAPSELEGQWTSGCFPFSLQPDQPGGATADFSFVGNRWQIIFTPYAEAECKTPLFSLRREGPFAFGAPSATIEGATEMVFVGTHLGATAYSDEMATFLQSAGCGKEAFTVGEEQDVSDTGCLIFLPVGVRAIEYDIIAWDADGKLHFGVRPADNDLSIPEKRPTEINPVAYSKVEDGA